MIEGQIRFSRFGYAMANLGDINGDGWDGMTLSFVWQCVDMFFIIDVAISAPFTETNSNEPGTVFIYHSTPNTLLSNEPQQVSDILILNQWVHDDYHHSTMNRLSVAQISVWLQISVDYEALDHLWPVGWMLIWIVTMVKINEKLKNSTSMSDNLHDININFARRFGSWFIFISASVPFEASGQSSMINKYYYCLSIIV